MQSHGTSPRLLTGDALTSLSVDELVELRRSIDGLLFAPVAKQIDPIKATAQVEERLARDYVKAWGSAARAAVDESFRDVIEAADDLGQAEADRFVARMGVKLKRPLTDRQIKILRGRIDRAYKISKRATQIDELKVKPSFNLKDTRAINWIAKEQVLWIGDFYSGQLSQRIRAVSHDVVLNQGFSNERAGRELRRAVEREFGIRSGGPSRFAPQVPARYAGREGVDLYYRQLASVASQRSRVFSKVAAFSEAGVITYRLTNPNDQRTGQICQQMSGQVFNVTTAVEHIERTMEAETIEDVKAVQPWVQGATLRAALEGKSKGSAEATEQLQKLGAILPPFHPLCRTEPVVLSFSKPALAPPAPAKPRPPAAKPGKAPEKPAAPVALPPRARLPQPLPKGMTDAQLGNMTAAEAEHMWGGWALEDLPLATQADIKAAEAALDAARKDIRRASDAIGKSARSNFEKAKTQAALSDLGSKIGYERKFLSYVADDIGKLTPQGRAAMEAWDNPLRRDMRQVFPNQVSVSLANRNYKMLQIKSADMFSNNFDDLKSLNIVGEHVSGANRVHVAKGLKATASPLDPRSTSRTNVLAHEAGHAVDITITNNGMNKFFAKLPYERVSWYADTKPVEDVAESICLTLVDTELKEKVASRAQVRSYIVKRMFRTDESYRRGVVIFNKFERGQLDFDKTMDALQKL